MPTTRELAKTMDRKTDVTRESAVWTASEALERERLRLISRTADTSRCRPNLQGGTLINVNADGQISLAEPERQNHLGSAGTERIDWVFLFLLQPLG